MATNDLISNEIGWTFESVQQLTAMPREGIPVSVMRLEPERTVESVAAEFTRLGLTPPSDTGA